MKINPIKNISFGQSQFNIISMADNHGDILGVAQVVKAMQENKIIDKKDNPSKENIFAISGDYFMNPSKKEMLTKSHMTFGDIQYEFLKYIIRELKKYYRQNKTFHTIYTPGNHCYGGGDEWLYTKLFNAKMDTVMTNIDLKKSPQVARLIEKSNNISTYKIYEVQDNKKPDLKNHVLFMGVNIPSKYYDPGNMIKYTTFLDQTQKNDAAMGESDLTETISELNEIIKQYKENYPRGAVVLMSHMGNKLSNIIAQKVPGINVILNAHDHRDSSTLVGSTQILSHGQNNEFFRTVNLFFDDEGNLELIKNDKFDTFPYAKSGREEKAWKKMTKRWLMADLTPLVSIDKESIDSKELIYTNKIRYQNSLLANYITTAIKEAAKQKYPDLAAVGLPSTIIRNGLLSNVNRTTFNNIDLIDMFKGVDESVATLRIGELTGEELLWLVAENVVNNVKSPTRNALIQWSDIQINKKLFEKDNSKYDSAIKIRNPKTGKFEKINMSKTYKILLPDKYLLKEGKHYRMPQSLLPKFEKIDESYESLFKQYLDMSGRKVIFDDKIKEQRIIA